MRFRSIIRSAQLLFITAVFALFSCTPVQAEEPVIPDDPYYFAQNGIIFYDGKDYCNVSGTVSNANLAANEAQEANARTIIGIAKTYNLGKKGALIGLMVALTESHLRIYANSGIPISLEYPTIQATGNDHDSVGVFQQRVSMGWSTFGNGTSKEIVFQLMDVAYSAQAFFGTPPGAQLPAGLAQPSAIQKGLQNKAGWETMEPWLAAQKVQVSFDPTGSNYKEHMQEAQALIDKLYESSPNIPLPISVTGGQAAGGTTSNQCVSGGTGSAVNTAVNYSWPDYHEAPYLTLKPVYETAIQKALSDHIGTDGKNYPNGEYIGDKSCPGVDCGGFVTRVMRDSRADVDYNAYQGPVTSQRKYLDDHPEKYQKINGVKSTSELIPGDIWINSSASHTYMYVGTIDGFGGNSASASQCGRSPMASAAYGLNETWYRLIK